MISGLESFNPGFLTDLSGLENRISQVNKQISSGYRVNQASDDPAAVAPIIAYQNQMAHIQQVQANLKLAQTDAQTADGALQSASTLLNQLVTLGSQGVNSSTSATTRATLGQQVQQIEGELVSLANTTVGGRYIFGGDDASTQPYTFDWTQATGVIRNSNPSNTTTIRDSDGGSMLPRLTAGQIFDLRDAGDSPAAGNIFAAAHALGTALLNNDESGIKSAIDQVKAGATQLTQSTVSYGDVESWIATASQTATTHLNMLTAALSDVRDTDVAADATQLSLDQTALQAALAAHASLNTKSLFSFLG